MPNKTIALIQFDAKPEQAESNLGKMRELVLDAASQGARWIIFHEGTICDYTPHLPRFAERVPTGESTKAMADLANRLQCFVSFGLSEISEGNGSAKYFITQVFVGPDSFLYRYRKTWLWHEPDDKGYRNEWARYDPGTGPEIFQMDGVRGTCFICADGEAQRCIERAAQLQPQVVFFPNNRACLPGHEIFGGHARSLGAPLLVTNRVGKSWDYDCSGGCTFYGPDGAVLSAANREGQEEILIANLELP